ncbi:hypothetical protein LJK87_06465 [Paenibacillus sp. P25]|nr:hypothetical protein LJK87_06465 [Paenibacillus sp. P25]
MYGRHNDSWPGTSWSMIDYELLPKASFYYAKKFYHPLLLSLEHEPEQPLNVWVVNDRIEAYEGKVRLSVYDVAGTELYTKLFDASVPSNGAVQLGSVPEAEALGGRAAEEVVVKLTAEGFEAPENMYYLRDPKDLRMPAATLEVEADEAGQTVTIAVAGSLARLVKIDLPLGNIRFSDNFFDLLPGERRIVKISDPEGKPVSFAGLKVSALNVR